MSVAAYFLFGGTHHPRPVGGGRACWGRWLGGHLRRLWRLWHLWRLRWLRLWRRLWLRWRLGSLHPTLLDPDETGTTCVGAVGEAIWAGTCVHADSRAIAPRCRRKRCMYSHLYSRCTAEFQWFLTELSVRPGSNFAISAQRFPCSIWPSSKMRSSSSVQPAAGRDANAMCMGALYRQLFGCWCTDGA